MSRRWFDTLIPLFALCLQGYALEAVKLEYKWTPDQLLRYKVSDVLLDNSGLGFIGDMHLEGILRLRTLRVLPNGDAELRMAYESGTITAMGKTEEFSKKLQPLTFTMTKAGVIKDLAKLMDSDKGTVTVTEQIAGGKSTASTDAYLFVLEALSNNFPANELKIGDTWPQQLEFASMEKPILAQCILLEVRAKDGDYSVARFTRQASAEETEADADGASTAKLSSNSNVSFSAERGFVTRVRSENEVGFTMGGEAGLFGALEMGMKENSQLELLSVEEGK